MSARARRRERGFALLIVLWTTSLLALIGAQVTAAGRTETRIAGNIRGSAIAEAAADAAVQEAAIRLMRAAGADPSARLAPYLLKLPQAAVAVSLEDEARKLPINTAPPPVIAALLGGLGADKDMAAQLARRIAEWRSPMNIPGQEGAKAAAYRAAGRIWGPSNQAFRDAADLSMVLGIGPALLARLSPHISVYTQSSPKPETADPVVVEALRQSDSLQALSFEEAPIYRITALANAAGGGQFIRRAVIRISVAGQGGGRGGPAGAPARAFDVLDWREGAADGAE